MSESLRQTILRQFRATHDGDPWYGSSRARVLRGVTAAQAAARPVPGGHSIWELVLHMTAWTEEVLRRLDGASPATPARGDWPAVPTVTDAAWRASRAALTRAHAAVCAAVEALPSRRFSQRVGQLREPALGTGITVAEMLVGLSQHDAYHIGQIVVLTQARRAQESSH
jgi:uncharacterized damage-inducible protein DinB